MYSVFFSKIDVAMDVHTVNEEDYLVELRSVANDTKKTVYAIYDDGALLYNRHIE